MGKVEAVCGWCGVHFMKQEIELHNHNFCCIAHFRKWNSKRMSDYNRSENEVNQSSWWTDDKKEQQREKMLGSDIKSYRKYHGRHEHRVVMEEVLGRTLTSDEIVHHIDGDKTNNSPSNLQILTRAEHARVHFSKPHRAKGVI